MAAPDSPVLKLPEGREELRLSNHQSIPECCEAPNLAGIPMVDYPVREFSMGAIDRAGRVLATEIPSESVCDEAVRLAFKTAHNWRMAHAYPMIAERMRLGHIATGGYVTAGRVKRMTSIRKKLKRGSASLRGMQDLAGCRAVMPSVSECYRVYEAYRGDASQSRFHRAKDYMAEPKDDGYRGIHVVLKFGGAGRSEPYLGQHIELQIRTRLQHVWATAIEAIGAVRGEDLKAGQGDADWLHLMALMGDYLAVSDGLPLREAHQSVNDLCHKVRDLEWKIGALTTLRAVSEVIDHAARAPSQSHVFRLTLNAATGRLDVAIERGFTMVGENFMQQETERQQSVVVNVDRVRDLRRAFPNYYLDLGAFIRHLAAASSFMTPPLPRAISDMGSIDLSFLDGWKRRKR